MNHIYALFSLRTGAVIGGVLAVVLLFFISPVYAFLWGACAALLVALVLPRLLRGPEGKYRKLLKSVPGKKLLYEHVTFVRDKTLFDGRIFLTETGIYFMSIGPETDLRLVVPKEKIDTALFDDSLCLKIRYRGSTEKSGTVSMLTPAGDEILKILKDHGFIT